MYLIEYYIGRTIRLTRNIYVNFGTVVRKGAIFTLGRTYYGSLVPTAYTNVAPETKATSYGVRVKIEAIPFDSFEILNPEEYNYHHFSIVGDQLVPVDKVNDFAVARLKLLQCIGKMRG